MCYASGAHPPVPPIRGAASSHADLELNAADGNRFATYAARAERSRGAGIVILPDVRGLHNFYKELAVRFAEAGIEAVAFDYFGRTAGIGPRDDDFDYQPHRARVTPENVASDVAACLDYLRSSEGGAPGACFVVGFCFGGGYSWRQAAEQPGLRGAIGFYGRPQAIADALPRLACPLLMLAAGADAGIPIADVQELDRRLTEARKPHELHVYPDAPHSFFDRKQAEHQAASDDAWRRMLDFIARNSDLPRSA